MARKRGIEAARDRVSGHPLAVTVQSAAAILGGVVALLTLLSLRKRRRR